MSVMDASPSYGGAAQPGDEASLQPTGPDIVYLAADGFLNGLFQRPHALALQLARFCRVLYVNPSCCSVPHYGFEWLFQRSKRPPIGLRKAGSNLWVLDFLTLIPGLVASPNNSSNLQAMAWQLRRAVRSLGFQNLIHWLEVPWTASLADCVPASRVFYDYLDDFPAFFQGRMRQRAAKLEARALRNCDAVIATSDRLAEKARRLNGNVHVVRNGVMIDRYQGKEHECPIELRNLARPILGYIGHLGAWFNWALVRDLAGRYRQGSIVLVGRGGIPRSALAGTANVLHAGLKPHSEIPRYLAAFDVCLIPFLVNELTLAVNPVKFYEHCAAGKPTVSVRLPELEPYSDICYLADSQVGFVRAVDLALRELENPAVAVDLARRRRRMAEENSWDARGNQIREILSATQADSTPALHATSEPVAPVQNSPCSPA